MLLCTIKEPSGVKEVGTEKEKDIMLCQKLINAVNAVGAPQRRGVTTITFHFVTMILLVSGQESLRNKKKTS